MRDRGQPFDHGTPAGVAERVEHPVELLKLRHIPKYRDRGAVNFTLPVWPGLGHSSHP